MPIILACLMSFGIVRFIGMGTGNKSLDIFGGVPLVAGMTLKQLGSVKGARKRFIHNFLAVIIIVSNAVIATDALSLFISEEAKIATTVKLLALLSGSFAVVQTLKKYEKQADTHSEMGELYTELYQKTKTIISGFSSNIIDDDQTYEEIKLLRGQYNEIGKSYNLAPSNSDFKKAKKKLETIKSLPGSNKD